jgi:hypothetical protein
MMCKPVIASSTLVCVYLSDPYSQVNADILKGKAVFFEDSVPGNTQPVLVRLRELGSHAVTSRFLADCLVTVDPVNTGQRCIWVASLLGLAVVSSRMFFAGHGPVIQYGAAVKTHRKIHLTDDFRQSQPVLTKIVTGCAAKPFSNWKLVPALTPGSLQLISDVQDAGGQSTFGPSRFLAFCKCPTATLMGVCGI